MEVRTKVSRSKTFEKKLTKVPNFIQKKVAFWVSLVESSGLAEVTNPEAFLISP
jgi:hypothetical protein